MINQKEETQKVINLLYEDGYEEILEINTTPNFIEAIVKMGGDVSRVRVYPDGSMYEK